MTAITKCSGGIVIGDGSTIAVVRRSDKTGWWLPKGHNDEGETDEEAARREVTEETGITELDHLDDLGTYSRYKVNADGSDDLSELKEIHMYLFAAPPHAELAPTMEIAEARWMPITDVAHELENIKDKAWFATVFDRVREAIQRD